MLHIRAAASGNRSHNRLLEAEFFIKFIVGHVDLLSRFLTGIFTARTVSLYRAVQNRTHGGRDFLPVCILLFRIDRQGK